MLEKPSISNDTIIQCLHEEYGIDVATMRILPLGADMGASIYKAQAFDKTCYFIKIKREYNDEVSIAIMKLLCDSGIKQIIAPIANLHGQQSRRIGDYILIAYPFIKGKDGFNHDLTKEQWTILGKALRQLHEVDVPLAIQKHIRREDYPSKWRDGVKSLLGDIDKCLNEEETAQQLLRFWKENKDTIQILVDRAEVIAKKCQDQMGKFVLCHSDIHGGNVLIDEQNSIYIVDWDDPIMAPKERDLMFIGGGVANVWNKPYEEKFFYDGYGEADINQMLIAYYRHERILEDILLYCEALLFSSENQPDRQKMYTDFADMFQSNGVVDIALKASLD